MTYHQLKYLLWSVVVGVTLPLTSCMKWDYGDAVEDFNATGAGLFITNEGNFQYGNATLSYYDPATKQVQNEIFFRANGMKLGDVAQSMTIYAFVQYPAVVYDYVGIACFRRRCAQH